MPPVLSDGGRGAAPSLRELVTDTLNEMVENQLTGVWVVAEAVTGALLAACRRLSGTDLPPIDTHVASSKESLRQSISRL